MTSDVTATVAEVLAHEVEHYCRLMHDAYEAAAARAGWETNPATRVPWTEVPEANKETMRAAVRALLPHVAAEVVKALGLTEDRLRWLDAELGMVRYVTPWREVEGD